MWTLPSSLRDLVIRAQAGIHPQLGLGAIGEMDPRLRRDDGLNLMAVRHVMYLSELTF